MKIWGFDDGHLNIYKKLNMQRPISTMKVFENPTMLLLTFTSGESYYLAWSNKNKNLCIVLPAEQEQYTKLGEDFIA